MTGEMDYFETFEVSVSDYYPFGMLMEGRSRSLKEYLWGFQGQERDDEVKGKGNSVYFKYRIHDPRLGRFFAVDPLAAKYPWNSAYAFAENRVTDGIELEGLEYKVTKDKEGNISGFKWDPENAFKDDGNLKDGYYHAAIVFDDLGTWEIGRWDKRNQRYVSYNIGSATATVFFYETEKDKKGNIIKTPKSAVYDASTMPSDPIRFATIKSGFYHAVRHKHKNSYWALQLKDPITGSASIPIVGNKNPSTGATTATGVNIHYARNNFTGTSYFKRKYSYTSPFLGKISSYFKDLNLYYGMSEACLLISENQYSDFYSHFPSGIGTVGVLVNRNEYIIEKYHELSNPDNYKIRSWILKQKMIDIKIRRFLESLKYKNTNL